MDKLTVIIITKNEEKNIARCLDSVKWADEIIIVDSGSTDRTIDIASQYPNVKVYKQQWLGYGPQKNIALSYATNSWILALDADEVLSSELTDNIQKKIQQEHSASVYKFKRLSQFCGKWIHHGDWGNDIIPRLFKKDSARYSNDMIHEKLIYNEKDALLSGILKHYSQESISISLSKLNNYSDATANRLLLKGKKPPYSKLASIKTGHLFEVFYKSWLFGRITWLSHC